MRKRQDGVSSDGSRFEVLTLPLPVLFRHPMITRKTLRYSKEIIMMARRWKVML